MLSNHLHGLSFAGEKYGCACSPARPGFLACETPLSTNYTKKNMPVNKTLVVNSKAVLVRHLQQQQAPVNSNLMLILNDAITSNHWNHQICLFWSFLLDVGSNSLHGLGKYNWCKSHCTSTSSPAQIQCEQAAMVWKWCERHSKGYYACRPPLNDIWWLN